MNDKKVLISVGPIPARLDSVKFITNRFKGGLAFKTAYHLLNKGYDTTIIMWKHTQLPNFDGRKKTDIYMSEKCHIVTVTDVVEYCDWIREHALEFDAFIMAAAVANLMPSSPYEDKFPSHLYKVGDKFPIEFEIAPRAIDIVKEVNPRCCLIGYKLFDAKTDEELIEIARHTLHDSKANIIFANTPEEAKTRKIALFQDNTALVCTFDEHLDMIEDAIKCEYFKTLVEANIYDEMESGKINKIRMCKEIVKKFEKTLPETFGTIAIRISKNNDFVTTSRGHYGEPVYVKNIDISLGHIIADGKATLNAPALYAFMESGYDYVLHRHNLNYQVDAEVNEYLFPGTKKEYEKLQTLLSHDEISSVMEKGHGYLAGFKVKPLDWNRYYEIFGDKYGGRQDAMERLIAETDKEEWLDVGCNTNTKANYILDPNVFIEGKKNVTYEDDLSSRFKLITLKNCINYLTEREVETLKKWLKPDGLIIANTFLKAPDFRVKENESVYLENDRVHHYIIKSGSEVYCHTFHDTNMERLLQLGFAFMPYHNGKSVLITYRNRKM